MMPMVSSMVPLHFLHQDNKIEMEGDFYWLCDAIGIGIISHQWHFQWHMELMPALILPPDQRSCNTSKQSSQHYRCNAVTDDTISFMLLPFTQHKLMCSSTATYKPHNQLVLVHIRHYVSIYVSYEPTATNNVNMNSGIHTFTLLAYSPEQICVPHCTCVPLHYCFNQHTDPTLLLI